MGVYELNLGVILAATAIVFSRPLGEQTNYSVGMLVLVQDETRHYAPDEGLRAALIEPARNGDDKTAKIAHAELLAALRQHASEAGALEMMVVTPTDSDTDLDVSALVLQLLRTANIEDIALTIDGDMPIVELKLPHDAEFNSNGVLYVRDLLSGENNVLFDGQEAFADLYVVLRAENSGLYLLDDEDYDVDPDDISQDNLQDTISSRDHTESTYNQSELEGFISRVVLVSGSDDVVSVLQVLVYAASKVVGETDILVEAIYGATEAHSMRETVDALQDEATFEESEAGFDDFYGASSDII